MITVEGTYQNGHIKLNSEPLSKDPVKVLVTFLEDIEIQFEKRLTFSDFSFVTSREALKDYKGSFSDTVIEERREAE